MSEKWTLAGAKVALFVFWFGYGSTVLLATLPDHPLRIPALPRAYIFSLNPEGWAFFTKDPREPVDVVLQWSDGELARLSLANAEPRYWFGIRKMTRVLGVEWLHLQSLLPRGSWMPCSAEVLECLLESDPPVIAVTNTSLTTLLCGHLVVERRAPVPWAWSGPGGQERMPGEFVQFRADCSPEASDAHRLRGS